MGISSSLRDPSCHTRNVTSEFLPFLTLHVIFLPSAPGPPRESSGAEATKDKNRGSGEEPIKRKDAKNHDSPTRRVSLPDLGAQPIKQEIESGSHTDSESVTARSHPLQELLSSGKFVKRQNRARSGPRPTTWAPATVEKIVKSWKETRQPLPKPAEVQVASDSKLGPRRGKPHVDFL